MGDDLAKDGPGGPENRRITVSYLAGFLDGEGCVYARRRERGVQLVIEAEQVTVEPLELLRITFGGSVTSRPARGLFRWRLCHRARLQRALRELLPHLTVKREQARLALELLFLLPPARTPPDSSTADSIHRLVDRIAALKRV